MSGALLLIGLLLAAVGLEDSVRIVPQAPEQASILTAEFDADLHNLLLVLGLKRKIIDNREQALSDAKAALRSTYSSTSPEFDAEWERRWKAKFNFDEVVDIGVRVYANYFTDAEVKQQISFQTARARHDEKPLAPELQKKIEKVMPAIQRDFAAEAGSYASRLSQEISSAIEKEHPDWVTRVSPQPHPSLY